MPPGDAIFHDTMHVDGKPYEVTWSVEMADDGRSFKVYVEITSDGLPDTEKTFLESGAAFSISNPLDIGAIFLHAATLYAFCVGGRVGRFSVKTVVKAYRTSRSENPDLSPSDRASDIYDRLKEQGGVLADETYNSLVDCANIKIFERS